MVWFIFIVFGLIVLSFIGGIGYLIYRVIKKSVTPKTPEYIANEQQEMRDRIAAKKADLEPIEGSGYKEVTSAMSYQWKKTTSNYLKGTVYSPDRKSIVTYDRVERGLTAKGYMYASTKQHDLFFEFDDCYFKFFFDGNLLGEVRCSGEIVDANGNVIGSAKHPTKMSFNVSIFRFRSGDNKFPLNLNGRHLANIWVAPNYGEHGSSNLELIFNENGWGQPIIETLSEPSEEEEKWLLSFAIFEIAFHGHWLI
jgi:hypothetical protein